MAWLTNWAKRIELTIDSTKVDSVLSNFPVLVKISNSSGIDTTDVTSVFTELGSDSNRKKIAATTDNGITQCYVEIERFDYANSVAWLWIKIPSIASGASTIFYLYYDSGQADNTTYIGDTTDAAAQSVWDSNFVGVWHMSQDPSGGAGAIKDSTPHVNHGTSDGTMLTEDLVDGKVGKGIDFDGGDDYIDIGDVSILDGAVACTFEIILNRTSFTADGAFIRKWASGQQSFVFGQSASESDQLRMLINDTGAVNVLTGETTNANIANSTTVYAVGVWGGSNTLTIYENAVSRNISYSFQNTPVSIADTTEHLSLSGRYNAGSPDSFTNGVSDEIRISNTDRSAAWIKATYYSNWDTLITYGTQEMDIVFTFSNPIPVDLSTTYGTTQQLYLTTTISGEPSYTYDAAFYDTYDDSQISSTVYGTQSGQPAGVIMSTPSGIAYSWYVTAVSSGVEDTSSTYTFSNRFLYDGYVTQESVPVDRVVRLYHRDTGELVDSTTSSGVGGYYYLSTTISEEHFIVVFDDDLGDNYNALILDKLLPEV